MTCESGYRLFELPRSKRALIIVPKLFKQFTVCDCQLTLGAKRVLIVKFPFEVSLKEIIREPDGMTQALNAAAHVARVLEIFQTSQAHSGILGTHTYLVPIFDSIHWIALLLMEPKIILLALRTAIRDTHAFAMDAKLLNFKAKLALGNNLKVLAIPAWIRQKYECLPLSALNLNEDNVSVGLFIFGLGAFGLISVAYNLIDRMIDKRIETVPLDFNFLLLWVVSTLNSLKLRNWARPEFYCFLGKLWYFLLVLHDFNKAAFQVIPSTLLTEVDIIQRRELRTSIWVKYRHFKLSKKILTE